MDWLKREITTGLQKLLFLSLDRTPAMDALPGTVATWLETLTSNRTWDEGRDAPRIRKAFVTLAGARSSWPAPKDLIEALPASEQKQLPRSTGIPATKEEREANLARLKMLYGDAINPID